MNINPFYDSTLRSALPVRIGIGTAALIGIFLLAGTPVLHTALVVQVYTASALVPFSPKNSTSIDQGVAYDGIYYVSDRSNNVVHVIDIASAKQVAAIPGWTGRVETNNKTNSSISGPNGLVLLQDRLELWVGDGDGSIGVVSMTNNSVVAKIPTGSSRRADEMAYDSKSGIVVCTNPNDDPPYVTVISAESRVVMGHIVFNNASGLEQPVFDPVAGTFYVSVPSTGANPGGEITALDLTTMSIGAVTALDNIIPAGIVFGQNRHLFVSAAQDQILEDNTARSVILDMSTGKVIANISGVAGVDQVAYNPTTNQFLAAAYRNLSPAEAAGSPKPFLAIIDASTYKVAQTITTDNVTAHSVAVDLKSNKVIVPLSKAGGFQIFSLQASAPNDTATDSTSSDTGASSSTL